MVNSLTSATIIKQVTRTLDCIIFVSADEKYGKIQINVFLYLNHRFRATSLRLIVFPLTMKKRPYATTTTKP